MRLDKFLKISRIIKRRTLAKEVCDSKRSFVNERLAKAGTEVKPGDIVKLHLGQRRLVIKIIEIKNTISAQEASSLYKVIEDYRVKDEL